MFTAILPYIVNTVILIGYFMFCKNRAAWPEQFLFWAWVPFIAHVWFHHFADGLQNTTRNIARIYLIKNYGVGYDNRLVVPIQMTLVPRSILPITILWVIAHIGSFTMLLIFQGWAIALLAEFGLMHFGGVLPINYQSHLRRVYKHTQNLGSDESFELLTRGVFMDDLIEVIRQAVEERKNPQDWWAIVLKDAIQNKITNKK